MYTDKMIVPLGIDAVIYALYDEKGQIIGTGTREVCEALVSIMNNKAAPLMIRQSLKSIPHRNIRAAIVI